MKILITEPRIYQNEYLNAISHHDILTENIFKKSLLKMHNDAEVLFIALDTRVDKEAIDHFPNLKYIITPTTGIDHIDVDYCLKKNIEVISLKGENEFLETITPTAELAFGLMLSVTRNISSAFESVKDYNWYREKFVGSELKGKTLGILGFGRIGKILSGYAKAFSMNVIAYDPNETAKKEMKKSNVIYKSWKDVFKKSDIVSVHINLEKETHNIIGKKQFDLMKKDAILINTSRGKIIEEKDLLEALETGRIRGAGLDVLATEQEKEHPQINSLIAHAKEHSNIVITPHIGGSTHESIEKTVEFVIKKFLKIINEDAS